MERVRVLLLEDHEGEAILNQRLLQRSYTTEFAFTSIRTLAEALDVLREQEFDVALLDLNLPDSNGLATYVSLQSAAPRLPVVIISAIADERIALETIRHGAQDYLVKGNITSETLMRVVGYAIARKQAEQGTSGIVPQPLQEGLPLCGAFLLDGEGNIIKASTQTAVLFGETNVFGILNRPLPDCFVEEDRPRLRDVFARVRQAPDAEGCVVRSGGERGRQLLVILEGVTSRDGSTGFRGSLTTAPAAMVEEGGEEFAQRYSMLLEHSQDGVFVFTGRHIVFANEALARMLGMTVGELLEKDIRDLIAPEDSERVLGNYRRRIEGEETENEYEFQLMHHSGRRVYARVRVGRIPYGDGFAVLGTLKNVTEEHRGAYLARLQHRLAIDLAQAHRQEVIIEHVLQGVLRIEHIDVAAVYVRDGDSGELTSVLWRGLRGPFPVASPQPDFDAFHAMVLRQAAPLYFDSASLRKEHVTALLSPEGIRSLGIIPVAHGGMMQAVLHVASLTAEDFDERIRQTLESIASFLGGVIARVMAEQARDESERMYRAVVEKSHDAIFIYRDDVIVFANEKCLDLTGYSREELLESHPWTLIHPEDRSRIQSIAAQRISNGDAPVIYEGRILTRDGTIRIGEFAATLIRYEGYVAALVSVRDITSRKAQEEELRRADALIRAAGFAATRFLRASRWEESLQAVLERFGKAANVCRVLIFKRSGDGGERLQRHAVWVRPESQDSMLGHDIDEPSLYNPALQRWVAELSAGRSVSGIIDDFPDEEQLYLARQNVRSVAALPIFSGDYWWGFVRFDECRLRRSWLSAEIDAMGVGSETLGAAIQREQAEYELIRSREQAVRADAIKNAFIANISHEVRTPVNIMLGYLALIGELTGGSADDEMNEFTQAIDDAAQRLIRTVDSIMNISRFQARDIAVNKRPLRLDKLLEYCCASFRDQIEEKGLSLAFRNECGAVEISGDQHFLTEAFNHLLDNAMKFTSTGGVIVTLSATTGKECVVGIEDTGIGMSPDFLEKIFDPYLQEDIGYNRGYEGMGLGMTLVKLYLEAHDAGIRIDSRKNEGTKISIAFSWADGEKMEK
jgi:PAS domain S-box-containing protein